MFVGENAFVANVIAYIINGFAVWTNEDEKKNTRAIRSVEQKNYSAVNEKDIRCQIRLRTTTTTLTASHKRL